MRLLILAACVVVAAHALSCPQQCDCGTGDELDYFCRLGSANVTINARTNEYVTIKCRGTNFTCSDLPLFNLANNLTLPSLAINSCSPSILRCVPQILQASSFTTIVMTNIDKPPSEEDVKDLGDVQTIWIRAGVMTIPSDTINGLRTLRNLRISSSDIRLQSNGFQQSPPLKLLELSMNDITDLPEDTFKGLNQLEDFYVWGNNFSHIADNSLRGLDSLKRLSLNSNDLTTIAPGSFAHTPRLQSIWLSSNRLKEIPAGVLFNLTDLQNITLQNNKLELNLHPKSLSNLTSLKNLHLEYSRIKTLPDDLLTGNDALITLGLSHNDISSLPLTLFKGLKSLENLDLSFNKIKSLHSGIFASLKRLKTLNLNRNYLEVLPDFLFSGLRNLNYLSADHNSLKTISSTAFQGAISLEIISMAYNKLTLTSDREYFNIEEYSPFNMLVKLKKLSLNGNYISTMFSDWIMVLLELEELDLSGNNFTMLHTSDCQFINDKITVNLKNNKITNVDLNYAPSPTSSSPSKSQTNSTIFLDFNPLKCDCWIYNLAMRLQGAQPVTAEPKFNVGNARCASPPTLNGHIFKQVPPEDLNCDLPSEYCPSSCSRCQIIPAKSDLDLKCVNVPEIFPDPEFYGQKVISLSVENPPTYVDNLTLELLNVSNIGLEEIPFGPSKLIKSIDFSNNRLTKLPMEFLEDNITLYLANNPFECECWNAEDVATIKKSSFVGDLEQVTCLNGDSVVQMDVRALCYTWRAAIVASGTFLVLILIVAITTITIYKYSHEILVYITSHGLFPCFFIEDPTDSNKEYDIFISYAHKDRKYLQELLPKLEKDYGQKTCVHYRDWSVGDLIPEQINKSVENSRRTVILLSANFLESTFANMEFRTAHNLALKEGRTRVILILIEDVTKHEKLTDELKAYIKMNTYLSWDDPQFWHRLQRALPMRGNKKFIWPDVFKQAGVKNVTSGLDVHLNIDGKLVNVAAKDVV